METMTFKETVNLFFSVIWSILVWYTRPIRRLGMRVEKFKCEQCGAETGRGKEPNGWIVLKTEKILWYGNPTLKVDRIRREHFSNKDSSLDFCGYNCFAVYFRKLLGVEVGEHPKKIFSGEHSKGMWKEINDAETVVDLRDALYLVCCKLQELEAGVMEVGNG